jgi:hypothetical protein
MAASINASTGAGGGVVTTADATGNLNLQSGGSTVVAVTSTGVAVTGTLAVSGGVTLTTTLPVLQGGTGVTTSTGTTNVVLSNSPTLVGPSISSAVMTTMARSVITSGTAVASTSGTAVSFTGIIPSWVKRITVMFNGVSTNGVAPLLVQLGVASSYVVSGYSSAGSHGTAGVTSTVGFLGTTINSAAWTNTGLTTITNLTGNTWIASSCVGVNGDTGNVSGGAIALAGTLDSIRVIGSSTGSPTNTFDAGSINILYE